MCDFQRNFAAESIEAQAAYLTAESGASFSDQAEKLAGSWIDQGFFPPEFEEDLGQVIFNTMHKVKECGYNYDENQFFGGHVGFNLVHGLGDLARESTELLSWKEFQLNALRNSPLGITLFTQTENLKWQAAKANAFSFSYIEDPSEELQLYAVKLWNLNIRYIKNPSAAVQLAAK